MNILNGSGKAIYNETCEEKQKGFSLIYYQKKRSGIVLYCFFLVMFGFLSHANRSFIYLRKQNDNNFQSWFFVIKNKYMAEEFSFFICFS